MGDPREGKVENVPGTRVKKSTVCGEVIKTEELILKKVPAFINIIFSSNNNRSEWGVSTKNR